MIVEQLPHIAGVEPTGPRRLAITWSTGRTAELDLGEVLGVGDSHLAASARADAWGHNLAWEDGFEMGADALWLAALTVWGEDDTRGFLEWRLRHAMTASRAAEALGLKRSLVLAYSTGRKPVPRAVMLACHGWEALLSAA